MKTNPVKSLLFIILTAVLVAIGIAFLSGQSAGTSHAYDALAECISNSGAKFYGAFWCPHCAEQKKLFEASVKLLPYKECSTPDAVGQTEECKQAKIDSYPTWEFKDGSRISEVLTPEKLAELTSCRASLPNEASTTAK